jgi:hypothetical protein
MSEMIILLKELSCDFYSKPDEEIIFKGMRMGPIIDFGNESEETIDYKCHFCSNENLTRESLITRIQNLTYDGFISVYFCDLCKTLLYFDYRISDGLGVWMGARRMIIEFNNFS